MTKNQGHLDGMKPERDDQLHALATTYAGLRDTRMATGVEEVQKKGELIGAMRAKKLDHYQDDEVTVDLRTKDEVKVKLVVPGGNGEPE